MSQLLGALHVDPFAVEDPSELPDWQIPLSFMKDRHTSSLENRDGKTNNDSWRIKDRVCNHVKYLLQCRLLCFPDEDLECGIGIMPEYWSRSTRCCEDQSLCSQRILDRLVFSFYPVSNSDDGWNTDPLAMSPQKGLELIGNNLQKQYERWQPRARYKQLLDPTTEEVRKLCLALRKNAKVRIIIVLL